MSEGRTATETIESQRRDMEERIFDDTLRNFLKRYRPTDTGRGEPYEFEVDLHRLIRCAFAHAQRPFAHELQTFRANTLNASLVRPLVK